MNNDLRTYARTGYVFSHDFLAIARESYQKWEQHKVDLTELEQHGGFYHENMFIHNKEVEISAISVNYRKETVKAVIFLTSFLESYFFDLSAIVLGQGYTEKYIERLDLESKLILIPRLITGEEIDRSKHFWVGIKELIKWRNKLIHNKTQDAFEHRAAQIHNGKISNESSKPSEPMVDLKLLFDSVIALFSELDRIDPKGSHKWHLEISEPE